MYFNDFVTHDYDTNLHFIVKQKLKQALLVFGTFKSWKISWFEKHENPASPQIQ